MKAKLNSNDNFITCCWQGCSEEGKFPAPKSPQNTRERYNFCLEHVRQYNKSWNFFRGMSPGEIERFQTDSVTGHRPTSKMGVGGSYYNTEELREKILNEFQRGRSEKSRNKLPDNERDALAILGLNYPITMKEIKRKYKELAKLYHPDVNGHKGEEKLKVINQAYSYLKSCGYFKD